VASTPDLAQLLDAVDALGNLHRLRIIAALHAGRQYVSELARQLGLSRPLLYLHLDRLERAGFLVGSLELSQDGKAMKYYELKPFALKLDAPTIAAAVRRAGPQAGA
jgi:predicted transcriptional regulator